MAEKSPETGKNWKKLQKQTSADTLKNRDVYDTQQLERTKIDGKQTMTSRAIIAGAVGVITAFSVWTIWSVIDRATEGVGGNKEIPYEVIEEPASSVPRNFTDLEYVNMQLQKDDYYSALGYSYRDIYTNTFYTEAEYKQWAYVIRKLENHEYKFAQKYNEKAGRSVYVERSPLDPADPNSVRDMPEIDWLNMQLVKSHLYDDIGYDYADIVSHKYFTQAEYDHWIEVAKNAFIAYGDYQNAVAENPDTPPAKYMRVLDSEGNFVSTPVSFKITPQEYLEGKSGWYGNSYLTISSTSTDDQGAEVTYLAKASVTDDGTVVVTSEYDSTYGEWTDFDAPVPVTDAATIQTLTMNYTAYSWYDTSVLAEREVITENASVVPREYTDLEWANMYLTKDSTYARYGYTWLDIRTGKFYTEAEFASFLSVQNRISSGELLYWRETVPGMKGYIYSEADDAPVAPAEARPEVRNYTNEVWLDMNMVDCGYEPWAKKGWTHIDLNTMLCYSDAEYEYYEAVMQKVESGEIKIDKPEEQRSVGSYMGDVSVVKLFASILSGFAVFGLLYTVLKRNLDAQNLLNDTSDINQHANDQHIALPEEVMRKFDWFPDAGAHCPVQVSSMVSHVMLNNKGLDQITVAERADKDIYEDPNDKNSDILYYKGEILLDDDGNEKTKKMPMIDMDFGEALFEASGNPKEIRKFYDTTKIPYNPGGKDRTKQAGTYDTVAEMINAEWKYPLYEPQRPAGAYLVDTEPVNTMVLAITRAGKGQTVIEATIDMWTREMRPNNCVVNDPKGELLVKFYVRGTVRGFQIVQFNLINAMKTDIYNPLGMAADAAREGDFTKCAMYVQNIADVFFPVDGGDDPVWPNAANNAFKRAAYGLMDYYLEEEKELRRKAEREGTDEKILETQIDTMWGKVTLYNCYQMFVQLTSKKLKNPASEFQQWSKEAKAAVENAGEGEMPHSENPDVQKLIDASDEEYEQMLQEAKAKQVLWEDKPETDLLSLYFTATDMLPKNSMRNLVSNANNALKSMAGAEKMLASVYGIAITAMSFFTDPTISTLTSGTPSQNVDLAGMSFPRRLGVRFHSEYVARYHLVGLQVRWDAFEDPMFTQKMGKDFEHEDLVTREGWARYYFKGIFPTDTAYLRMRVMNANTNQLVNVFYFKFTKSYQTSLDGRVFVKDPVLGSKIAKNGTLVELQPIEDESGQVIEYRKQRSMFKKDVVDFMSDGEKKEGQVGVFIRTMTRYSEKCKMVFLVTPPHLMGYAKLILILIKQLVDLNFDQSYMTKSNQKPLYKTRFMLDELGNLQSEGHGISGFETMLSIGLGQEQQFTLILQTLQQRNTFCV